MNSSRLFYFSVSLIFIALLSSCGGGSNDSSNSSNPSQVGAVPKPLNTLDIDQAFATGDSSKLLDAKKIAELAQYALHESSQEQVLRYESLYRDIQWEFDPTNNSQWIEPANTKHVQPLIVGDKGKYLASISIAAGGRSAGFGSNIFHQLNTGELQGYRKAFYRLLGWLIFNDADAKVSRSLNVATYGIDTNLIIGGFERVGVKVNLINCDVFTNSSCIDEVEMIVLGGGGKPDDSLGTKVRGLLARGKPIIYSHTQRWDRTLSGEKIIAAMGMKFGPYAGNYWEDDKVETNRPHALNSKLGDQFAKIKPLVQSLAADKTLASFDWSLCSSWVGQTDCSNITELNDALLAPVEALRSQLDVYNRSGQNIFATEDTEVLRYLVLWADVVRRQLRFPMDKAGTFTAFQKAFIADALIAYVRQAAPAQLDLGTFSSKLTHEMPVTDAYETVTVFVPSTSGFTAIGRLASAGKPVTVELLSGGDANMSLRLNTQRTGSTRLWDHYRYDRPRFLTSPEIALSPGKPVQLVSPYGGTLQLVFNNAMPQQSIQLRLRGVAKHPFLDQSNGLGNKAEFISALNAARHEWAEIKLAGIEIHSRAEMLRSAINSANYGGDIDKYLFELQKYTFEDSYSLAGFVLPGRPLTKHVSMMCSDLGWDCLSANIHRKPSVQHINIDVSAACGSACSGNPYDQTSPLNPRGGTETHEVGHNLQTSWHYVYEGKSSEVSNNFFTNYKGWKLLSEGLMPNFPAEYKSAFTKLIEAKLDSDAIDGAYKRIWTDSQYSANTAERLIFYMHWVHYWSERQGDISLGWDIVSLLYLHQRQLDATNSANWAEQRNRLGYSTYDTKPKVSGNDNLLISLSLITKRDQRAVFDLWGVKYSGAASSQVDSFAFQKEKAYFYANTSAHDHSTVRKVLMSESKPTWPF